MLREPRQRYTDEQIAKDHRDTKRFIRIFVTANAVFYTGLCIVAILALLGVIGD